MVGTRLIGAGMTEWRVPSLKPRVQKQAVTADRGPASPAVALQDQGTTMTMAAMMITPTARVATLFVMVLTDLTKPCVLPQERTRSKKRT